MATEAGFHLLRHSFVSLSANAVALLPNVTGIIGIEIMGDFSIRPKSKCHV